MGDELTGDLTAPCSFLRRAVWELQISAPGIPPQSVFISRLPTCSVSFSVDVGKNLRTCINGSCCFPVELGLGSELHRSSLRVPTSIRLSAWGATLGRWGGLGVSHGLLLLMC